MAPAHKRAGGICLAALFIAFVSFDRLYRIIDIGVDGSDAFFYLNTARDWAQGKVSLTAHYRPAVYLLDSIAFRLGGGAEYSVRAMHAALDIGAVVILLSLMYAASRSFVVSVAAGAMYATLPVAIERNARTEVTSGPSTFFIALCMYAFYMAMKMHPKWPSLLWAFVLGIACAIAANTHPDLVMAGPGFAVAMVVYYLGAARHIVLRPIVLPQIALSVGFLLPFIIVVWYFGFDEVVHAIAYNARRETVRLLWNAEVFWKVFVLLPSGFFEKYTREPFQYAFAVAILINAVALKRQERSTLVFAAMGIPLVFHFLGYAFTAQDYRPPTAKLFIPWLPWLMLWTVWGLHQLKHVHVFRRQPMLFWGAFVVCTVVLMLANRRHYRNVIFVSVNQPVAVYREVYDVLKHRVDNNKRVLLAPVTLYARGHPATHWVYFGRNGTYIRKSQGTGLRDVMKRERARFLAVLRKRVDRRLERRRDFGFTINRLYGIQNKKWYSLHREYSILALFALRQRATVLHRSKRVTIYQFPGLM